MPHYSKMILLVPCISRLPPSNNVHPTAPGRELVTEGCKDTEGPSGGQLICGLASVNSKLNP